MLSPSRRNCSTFSLKLGRSGEEEYIEVDEGASWVAAPKNGHGNRCISDDGGAVLAFGAPPVEEPEIAVSSSIEASLRSIGSKARNDPKTVKGVTSDTLPNL